MQDIFVTPLEARVMSWVEAFPKAKLADDIKTLKLKKTDDILFWLHMNVDRQEWLVNSIAYIQKHFPQAKMVVLANAPNQAEALHALSLGALGYTHAYSPAFVLTEIKTVISHGGVWMGQELLKRLIEVSTQLAGNQAEAVDVHLKTLSKREREVALEAAKGLSNKEIARLLNITERTVKAHLTNIFERLGAKDRLHLALMLNKK